MEALISGSAKLAAFISGDAASVVDCEGNTLHSSKYADVSRQFGSYNDTISLANTDTKSALKVLQLESQRGDALLLILSILDSSVPSKTKPELASCANSILENYSILHYVRGILYAQPLPGGSITSLPNSMHDKYPAVNSLIQNLLDSQETIEKLYNFWVGTALKFHLERSEIQKIEGVFASVGTAYQLCQSEISNSVFSSLKFECLTKLASIRNGRQLVTSLFGLFNNVEPGDSREIIPVEYNNPRQKKSAERASHVSVHDLYEQAKSQIVRITELLNDGDIVHAEKFTEELVAAQIERKDNAYAAMSLCSLSEEAKSIGNFSLQLGWAKRAVDVAPDDERTYGHVADAYLNLGQLDNARRWFERTIEKGDKYFGRTGLARIERALFDYEKALEIIEEICAENQSDYNVIFLKAGLNRDLGRLDDAAQLYKKMITDFPGESASMCGLAAVKTDMKCLIEAEKIYREAIELYPNEQVPLTGLGFLLAREGRFKEAFKLLDQGIDLARKNDIVPGMAKAKALRMKGNLEEAECMYVKLVRKYPFSFESRYELIETFVEQRKYEKAAAYLAVAKEEFKYDQGFIFTEANLHIQQSHFVEALQLLDAIKMKRPRWIKPLLARAKVLKQLEQFEEARKQYEEVLAYRPLEWRAKIGLEIIDALEIPRSDIDSDIKTRAIEGEPNLDTIDDWQEQNIRGLLLLIKNRTVEAKEILNHGYKKSPFKSNKEEFGVSLSVARAMLGQYGTAIKTVKNVDNDIGLTQRAIVYGEQGKQGETEKMLSQVKNRDGLSKVVSLISRRYSKKSAVNHEATPSVDQVINQQLRAILLAA